MPSLLKKRSVPKPTLADLDGGKLAEAVRAMKDEGARVVALEAAEGDLLRRLAQAEGAVPIIAAGVATGDLDATELPSAKARAAKLREEHDAAQRDLAEASATLAAIEELHGIKLGEAKKAAKAHFDGVVRAATQKLATAVEAAIQANEEFLAVQRHLDAIGIRPPHPNIQAVPELRGAAKTGLVTGHDGQVRGHPVVVETPLSHWLNRVRETGLYKMAPRFAEPSGSRSVSVVRVDQLPNGDPPTAADFAYNYK